MEPRKMMGGIIPGDEKVPVTVRDWHAMKLAVWRTTTALKIAARQAEEILERCEHADGCPGKDDETAPCIQDRYAPASGVEAEPPEWKRAEDGTLEDPVELRPQVLVESGCRDRELRMSALVILNAARQHIVDNARKPDQQYFAPSREYFSEVLATLAATQLELESTKRELESARYASHARGSLTATDPMSTVPTEQQPEQS